MGHIIFSIGAARSGKSTKWKQWLKEPCSILNEGLNKVVVCADEVRLAYHGERFLANEEKKVHEYCDIMIKTLMRGPYFIGIDETNSTIKSVRKWLRLDPTAEYFFVDTPIEECLRRAKESKTEDLFLPIHRMFDNLQNLVNYGASVNFKHRVVINKENVGAAVEKIRQEVIAEKSNGY